MCVLTVRTRWKYDQEYARWLLQPHIELLILIIWFYFSYVFSDNMMAFMTWQMLGGNVTNSWKLAQSKLKIRSSTVAHFFFSKIFNVQRSLVLADCRCFLYFSQKRQEEKNWQKNSFIIRSKQPKIQFAGTTQAFEASVLFSEAQYFSIDTIFMYKFTLHSDWPAAKKEN